MKNPVIKAFFLFALIAIVSCKGNNEPNPNETPEVVVGEEIDEQEIPDLQGDNVMEQIEGDPELGTFAQSLNGTNVIDHFRISEGPYTIFAPTNAAYSKMNNEERDTYFGTENIAFINYLVVQALLPPEILKEEIKKAGGSYSLITMQGDNLTATLENNKIIIEGVSGDTATVEGHKEAANGVVYVIDEVLFPSDPAKTDVQDRDL
ncbi:MAG TPA: fasciclin domain-containing protein [Salinimicrobium sp.]|nr:fasciclin domain-containing protein [Salinimicrobium sp.]